MTQSGAYALTHDKDTFVKGATAYRNTRDRAMTYRDNAIDKANEVARQMPAPSPATTFTDSRTSRSTPLVGGSDTSEDELARGEVIVKRLRPDLG